MTRAAELMAQVRARGGELHAEGDRLLYRPAQALSSELLSALKAHKDELLDVLHGNLSDPTDGPVLAERLEPVAWRLHSRLLNRELWLVRDERTADDLAAEFPGVPVLRLDEVPILCGKPPELVRAIVETKAQFPGARLVEEGRS